MLIQFRLENHRSLRDEQTLSMLAVSDDGDARLIHVPEFTEALLPAVAIYGANASGKSNALGALAFMKNAVFASHRLWEPNTGTPQEPFALSAKAEEPSMYEVDFLLEGVRYRYGFSLTTERIEEEWLFAWPRGRKQTWFERERDTFEFGKSLHGENEAIRGLTRPNSLFLSAAAQNNHVLLTQVFEWFVRDVAFRRAHPTVPDYSRDLLGTLFGSQIGLFDDQRRDRDVIVRLLRAADTGILDIRVRADGGGDAASELQSSPSLRRGRRRQNVEFLHRADDAIRGWLPLEEESAGTITLVSMALRLVRVLANGGLLAVDELDASLHPMIVLELLRIFQDPQQNSRGAQLLFTTHDTNLLGNVLGETALRRDQVWFAEKDKAGASHLYPLTQYRPRKSENLERGYLQGRYGAIPFLGQLVALPPKDSHEGGP